MIPGPALSNMNFAPNFANLAALHGMMGTPRPTSGPIMGPTVPYSGMPAITQRPVQMPGSFNSAGPVYANQGQPIQAGGIPQQGLPGQQPDMPMQIPGMQPGNMNNLRALMQMFGQQ